MEKLWSDNFDRIYCINLNERHDRYLSSLKVFRQYSIPVTYYHTDRNPNGEKGCFLSHRSICREAVKDNLSRILVFEDDIVPRKHLTEDNLKKVINVMNTLKDEWELFYLGCGPLIGKSVKSTRFKDIYKVKAYGAYVYALNKNRIHRMSETEWKGDPYDKQFSEEFHHAYIPYLFDPGNSESDIEKGKSFAHIHPIRWNIRRRLQEFYIINRVNIRLNILCLIIILILVFCKLKLKK